VYEGNGPRAYTFYTGQPRPGESSRMTIDQCTERLGITLEDLFRQAYDQERGVIYGSSPATDLAWYRKWKHPPPYVVHHLNRLEKEFERAQ